ncbi:MAG: hypothetical protein ACPGTQ_02350 [Colwellia sp.]
MILLKQLTRISAITCLSLWALPAQCEEDSFTFSGYVKSYALAQESISIKAVDENAPPQSVASNFQSQNALRLMSSYLSSDLGNFEVHYEVQPLYFSNAEMALYYTDNSFSVIDATISTASNPYRFKDLDSVLAEVGDHGVILQNLDRFNYQYSNQYGDLTIGRQVVSFGSSRFINPTDIFIPFAIQTLNQEYRVGIDAIRYKADIGDFAVIDMGVVIGDEAKKENSALFLRAKDSINGNDIEAIAILLDEAWLLGAGLERAIGDFGFWFETAYMNWQQSPKQQQADHAVDIHETPYTDNYWRTSVGSDYALNEEVIVMVEYHYNGAGSSNVQDYATIATQAPYQKAGVYLYGQHYLIPAVTWLASPLASLSASAFYNVCDHSVFFTLSNETSWSDNLYSDFGLYYSYGNPTTYQGQPEQISYNLGSEFGSYPVSLYASLRYYF